MIELRLPRELASKLVAFACLPCACLQRPVSLQQLQAPGQEVASISKPQ